jgi:hypothetical protein
MDQYVQTQDTARAGLMFGIDYDAETLVVPSGLVFEFGDPVFVDAGVEEYAFYPLSTDASLKFLGVAPISHRCYKDSVEQYIAYQDMNVVTLGTIWVPVASGISACANQAAYVVDLASDGNYKKFTTTNSADTYATGAYFRSNANTDGLALVELRGLN